MCNLYSITTNQAAVIALFRVINRYAGNLPPMPGVFPAYPALRSVVRSICYDRCLMDNLPHLAPISPRRNANKFLKHPVQLGGIAKTDRVRHINNRQFLLRQQLSCTLNPLRKDVSIGRYANRLFERPNEVERAQPRHSRQNRYCDVVRDLSIDKFFDPPQLTCRQTSPNWG